MGGGLQILTYTRYSWSLNSEGSSACHIYCDTGHPFKMVISHDPWHSHLLLKYKHEIKRYVNMQVVQNRTCAIMLTNCIKTHKLATSNWKNHDLSSSFFLLNEMVYLYKALYPCIHHNARPVCLCEDVPELITVKNQTNYISLNIIKEMLQQ